MSDLTAPKRAGHVLAVAVTVANAAGGAAALPQHSSGPPTPVIVISIAIALVVVALLVVSWRENRVAPRRIASVLMIVAALAAVPAFLVPGVATGLELTAGVYVLLTMLAVVLLFYPERRTTTG
ncbi:hypothetical protein [Nocardioides ultimimeridianus]